MTKVRKIVLRTQIESYHLVPEIRQLCIVLAAFREQYSQVVLIDHLDLLLE